MKNKKLVIRTTLIVLGVAYALYWVYIAWITFGQKPKNVFKSDYKFGIVQTTEDQNTSYITYFDKKLKKVHTQRLSYGSLGETVQFPQVATPKVYLAPHGTSKGKELSKIIAVNMKTGKILSYKMNQTNITNYQVDKYNVYSSAVKEDEVILTKRIKKSKKLSSLSLGKVTLDSFYLFNDKIYAFTSADDKYSIQVIDTESLKVSDTIDISNIPGIKKDAILVSDTLYFTNTIKKNDKTIASIGSCNLTTKKTESFDISLTDASQLFYEENKLIVTQIGSKTISVFDPAKKEETKHELKSEPVQCLVSNGKLYTLDDQYLSVYNLKNFSYEKKAKIPLKQSKTATFHFVGFFLKSDK